MRKTIGGQHHATTTYSRRRVPGDQHGKSGRHAESFNGFIRLLHNYLNNLPCLRDLQQARRRWIRPRETEAFGRFHATPHHWYTFNCGGRNKPQFNVGLNRDYLRVGLGFDFTEKQFGDPTAVAFGLRLLSAGRFREGPSLSGLWLTAISKSSGQVTTKR